MEILLWQGQEDCLLPMSHTRYLAKHLNFVKLTVVPGQGHFILHTTMNEILTALGN
jgi:pimeloyl-ACP methyl ester carboxylesterase